MASEPLSPLAALARIDELERELAALRASHPRSDSHGVEIARSDSDRAYVSNLLADDILQATRVRSWREPHPFGSTVAREALAEAELPSQVTIDAEDLETLPRRVRLRLAKGSAKFRVTARLRADDGRRVVYAVEEE
ncbi:MAG TPA: hypothetical protein VEI07_02040 [Planctomycetaceae bacterium]|nr:hypothetical protein [Planctomycetaceae bacterium]